MTSDRVEALILAAGTSERLGKPKALVTLADGRTLVARAIDTARAAGLSVTVAVPAGGGPVAVAAERAAGRVMEVHDRSAGMSASLRAGTRALAADPSVAGVMVLLVDQWRLTAADLRDLVVAWASAGRTVAAARYAGTVGVPAVFGRGHFDVLLGTTGDVGARGYLRSAADVAAVDLPNAGADLDTAADLREAGRAG